MSLEELRAEKTRCQNMKNAIGGLIKELDSFAKRFTYCSAHFNAGGLLIGGVPADVYTFGGFDKYAENKIKPVSNQLSQVSSLLSSTIQQIDIEIKKLEEEARREAELAAKAKTTLDSYSYRKT